MNIWIVESGEKRGPFQIYELRDRIEREELTGEELSWHRDQDEWVPLKELDVFRSEFEDSELVSGTPPPLPSSPQPFLRFWARWFDVMLYLLFVYTGLLVTGQEIVEALFSPWFRYLYFLPFLIMEALAIHLYKTTPGKFLLGIRVVTSEEGALPLGSALVRAVRVFILGMGIMFWPMFLPVICHGLCLWFTLRNGEAPWDFVGRSKVRVAGPFFLPGILFMVAFAVVFALLALVLLPSLIELGEKLEKGRGTT